MITKMNLEDMQLHSVSNSQLNWFFNVWPVIMLQVIYFFNLINLTIIKLTPDPHFLFLKTNMQVLLSWTKTCNQNWGWVTPFGILGNYNLQFRHPCVNIILSFFFLSMTNEYQYLFTFLKARVESGVDSSLNTFCHK